MAATILCRYSLQRRVVNILNLNLKNIRRLQSTSSSNVIKSVLPDIDEPSCTIPEFVYTNFDKFPNKTAVECGVSGKKITFDEIRIKSRNLNKMLRKKLNLRKGDVVAIMLPNIPEYPVCLLGSIEAGLTATLINPLYTPDEIKRQLLDSNARAIITLAAFYPLAKAATSLASLQIPILAIKMQESEQIPQGAIDFKEFTDTECDIEKVTNYDMNDVALLPYSSGTTGLPKGVELTQKNIVASLMQNNEPFFRLAVETSESHQDVVPGVLPWFHIYGTTVIMLTHLFHLAKLVSLPKFTPELYVTMMAKHKPNVLFIVPPIVLFMSNHPSVKKEYLQPVRTVISGAAPLGKSDEDKLLKKAEKYIDVLQGYGLTETSPGVILTSPIRKKQLNCSGTVGEVVSSTEVKVVPVDHVLGEPLGPHEKGELLVKGPQVMKGYHNKPEETAEVFVDGWLRTGDMVYYDDNKMFYVTDRLKELIKVKGFQVAPAELEEIIRSYPDVVDVGVIGVPDSNCGEVPCAYVVPRTNTKLDVEKLQAHVANQVANYKQLTGGVKIVNSIPKNAAGKILRKDLKLQYDKEHTTE